MEKIKIYSRQIVCVVMLFTICISLCACCKKDYFEYEGVWYSEEPFIELNCALYKGSMEIGGKVYDLGLAYANDGTSITMDDPELFDKANNSDEELTKEVIENITIWQADTVVKDGKLYLTVTKDNISDYEGKTIELKLRPYKEGEDVYPEEEE